MEQPQYSYTGKSEVTVTDVKMPFWSMVTFMVKAAFAAIPAVIIISIVSAVLMFFLSTFFAGLSQGLLQNRQNQQQQVR